MSGTKITLREKDKVKRLKDGDYRENEWLYTDGILTHIKRKKKIGQYIFFEGKIKGRNVIFDGEHYAHCESLKEGVQDIEFKKAKDRGAEQYRNTPLDKKFTVDEAVTMYRIITGACRQGSEQFVNSIKDLKDEYTLEEIIKITKGQYNSLSFEKFFEKE